VDGVDGEFRAPSAIPWVGLLLAIVTVPVWIVTAQGAATSLVLVTGGAALAVMCLLCAWLLNQTFRCPRQCPFPGRIRCSDDVVVE
jgi:hypothetical protein